MDLQPTDLKSDLVTLVPLTEDDFENVYESASDPLIWEQHPDKERYKREIFQTYFNGAIKSKGAFKICNTQSGEVIGCSRYYHLNEIDKTIMVGYTFLIRACWGGLYNSQLKKLMFRHAFKNGYKIQLQIGSTNIRSQKATEKLGAKKIKEEMLNFPNQEPSLHFVYEVSEKDFTVS